MEYKKLSSIAKLVGGFSFKSSDYIESGLRIIRIANVQDGYISDESPCFYPLDIANEIGEANLKENDLLMSLTGNVGRVAFINKDLLPAGLNQRVECIRPFDETIKPYLFYFFQNPKFKHDAVQNSSGSAQLNMSTVWLGNYLIPIYSPKERDRIVKLFKEITSAINKSKKQLNLLDELIKSRFIEMFEGKGYSTKVGKELFKFSSGKFLESNKRLESGIPVYGGNGIAWFTNESLTNEDTIVIGRVGAYCGNVRLVRGEKWITDNALYISKFKTNDFKLEFLEQLMIHYDFHQFAGAAAQPKITQKPLEEQLYLIPPKEEQIKYTEFVKMIDKSKFNLQRRIETLTELLNKKMDEFFGGNN